MIIKMKKILAIIAMLGMAFTTQAQTTTTSGTTGGTTTGTSTLINQGTYDSKTLVDTNSTSNSTSSVTSNSNTTSNSNSTSTAAVNSTSNNTNNNNNVSTSVNTNNNVNSGTSTINNNNVNSGSMTYTNNNNNVNSGTMTYNNNNVSSSTSNNVNTNNNINTGDMTYRNINTSTSTSTATNNNNNVNTGDMTYRNINNSTSTATNNNNNASTSTATNNNVNTGDMTNRNISNSTSASTATNNNINQNNVVNPILKNQYDSLMQDNIRLNTLAKFPSQMRAVTQQDYLGTILGMPPKFGQVAKAYVTKDSAIFAQYLLNQPGERDSLATSIYLLSYNTANQFIAPGPALLKNIQTYLEQYRMLTDTIILKPAYIINIQVNFDIILRPNYTSRDVIAKCLTIVRAYFSRDNWQVNQPIVLSEIYTLIDQVAGVQTVQKVTINNIAGTLKGYSQYSYDISAASLNGTIYPSLDPSIFEVKYPDIDIQGRVVTM
jgi:hypothetical protein